MHVTVTVVDPTTRSDVDLLLDLDEATTVGELTAAVVEQVRGRTSVTADVVAIGAPRGAGQASARMYVGGQPLDPAALVRDSPVREGALISLDEPQPSVLAEPDGVVDLRVVGGPGAGLVHRLGVGSVDVGSASTSGAALALPGVPDHAFSLDVDIAGACRLRPVDGVPLHLEHDEVDEPVPWPEGAHLRLADCLLVLARTSPPDAALQPSDDGVALDYNRPPRLLPPVKRTQFALPKEPVAPRKRSLPWLAVLAPLVFAAVLVTVLGSLRYALFALMSPVLAIGNYVSSRSGTRKQYRADLETYRDRKAQVEQDARDALLAERTQRRAQAPDPAEILLLAAGPRSRLWERRRADPDYLSLRVGTADLPSEVTLTDPEQLDHRKEVTWQVLDAPVTVSLAERGVVGLAGRPELTASLAGWLVAQAAVLHSPRDLQVVVLTDNAAEATWEWVRWLPHARPWAGAEALALVGNDAETVARRVGELQALVQARSAARRTPGDTTALTDPDVLVVLDGARRLRLLPGIVQVLQAGPAVGVHALCLDAEERLLPEECTAVVTQTGPATVTVRQQRQEVVVDARADLVPAAWFPRVGRALAALRDANDDGGDAGLPTSCRLLDVLGLEPPTPQAVLGRWQADGRTTQAVLGLSLDGPFAVDLRRDGPHALIAGTTGAGKSELLQTLVASLAVANRADAMTFVLVDYKGGSAFQSCVDLPHTVGMVTDLDSHLVERALVSLGAELHRRERLLADAGAKDIEDYTDLATDMIAGAARLPALPRLAIVIDEFASLARELPDFVAGLVNVAQRGRSLGIHLVLATQRPSGVVSPEIRANTNLRIALRVTDKAESSDVIDAPDAALITKSTPGRAFVRLGHSSLLPFQAGRVGGRRPGAVATTTVVPFAAPVGWSALGQPPPTRPRPVEAEPDATGTDLAALVESIRSADRALGVPAQPSPWLPPLPEVVRLSELPPYSGPERALPPVPFALADLPAQQTQRAEVIDLETLGHKFVIGSSRSGRTQALRTIAGAIAEQVSAADVHLHGIDCGNGGLLALTALPHCGAVVQRTQTDRVGRLLSRLTAEVARRQELLALGGYASVTEQRAAVPAEERLPHLVLFLDRWEGFVGALAELDGGRLQTAITSLLNEGASAGVHCVFSGDRSLASYRLAAVTDDKLVLRMADRSDYGAVGLSARAVPDVVGDGRAFQPDGTVETQIAVLDGPLTGQGQAQALAEIGAKAAARDVDLPRLRRPFRIDVLPSALGFDAAMELVDERPPLWALVGVGGDDLQGHGPDLAATPAFVVAGPPKSGRSTALVAMARSLLARGVPVALVAPRPSPLRDLAGLDGVRGVVTADRLTDEELGPLLAGDGPLVLLVDDAELHKETPAGDTLKAFLRTAGDAGRALVMGGDAAALGTGYTGWHAEARKGRAGALLCPQGASDGDLVGVRLPRSLVGEPVKAGRALLHVDDGTLLTVTVPT